MFCSQASSLFCHLLALFSENPAQFGSIMFNLVSMLDKKTLITLRKVCKTCRDITSSSGACYQWIMRTDMCDNPRNKGRRFLLEGRDRWHPSVATLTIMHDPQVFGHLSNEHQQDVLSSTIFHLSSQPPQPEAVWDVNIMLAHLLPACSDCNVRLVQVLCSMGAQLTPDCLTNAVSVSDRGDSRELLVFILSLPGSELLITPDTFHITHTYIRESSSEPATRIMIRESNRYTFMLLFDKCKATKHTAPLSGALPFITNPVALGTILDMYKFDVRAQDISVMFHLQHAPTLPRELVHEVYQRCVDKHSISVEALLHLGDIDILRTSIGAGVSVSEPDVIYAVTYADTDAIRSVMDALVERGVLSEYCVPLSKWITKVAWSSLRLDAVRLVLQYTKHFNRMILCAYAIILNYDPIDPIAEALAEVVRDGIPDDDVPMVMQSCIRSTAAVGVLFRPPHDTPHAAKELMQHAVRCNATRTVEMLTTRLAARAGHLR